MKKTLLMIGLLGMLSCTTNGDEGEKVYTKSYVIEYYSSSGIKAVWINKGYIALSVIPNFDDIYGVVSTDEADKARYEAMCILHEDYTYNQYFYYGPAHQTTFFQDRDFTDIEIISDREYDETHPAGTSLNDLFYFASASPAKYIARGYKTPYDWNNFRSLPKYFLHYLDHAGHPDGCEPVYGIVADLEAADLILLGEATRMGGYPMLAALTPVTEPTLDKTHDITITLTDTKGNELTAQVMITF